MHDTGVRGENAGVHGGRVRGGDEIENTFTLSLVFTGLVGWLLLALCHNRLQLSFEGR